MAELPRRAPRRVPDEPPPKRDFIRRLKDAEEEIRKLKNRTGDVIQGMSPPSWCYAVPNDSTAAAFWVKDPTDNSVNFMKIGRSATSFTTSPDEPWSHVDPIGAGESIAIAPPGPGLYHISAQGYVTSTNASAGDPLYWTVFTESGGIWWVLEAGPVSTGGRFATSIVLPMQTNWANESGGNPTRLHSIGIWINGSNPRNYYPTALTDHSIQGYRITELTIDPP